MANDPIVYTHPDLNQQVTAIGGNYVLTHEQRISVNHREVLYYKGVAVFDTTCCGAGGCAYVFVPGYILAWAVDRLDSGNLVSEILRIRNEDERKAIEKQIQRIENVYQVNFL